MKMGNKNLCGKNHGYINSFFFLLAFAANQTVSPSLKSSYKLFEKQCIFAARIHGQLAKV